MSNLKTSQTSDKIRTWLTRHESFNLSKTKPVLVPFDELLTLLDDVEHLELGKRPLQDKKPGLLCFLRGGR